MTVFTIEAKLFFVLVRDKFEMQSRKVLAHYYLEEKLP